MFTRIGFSAILLRAHTCISSNHNKQPLMLITWAHENCLRCRKMKKKHARTMVSTSVSTLEWNPIAPTHRCVTQRETTPSWESVRYVYLVISETKEKRFTDYPVLPERDGRWFIAYYVFPIFPLRWLVMQVLIAQKIKEEFECERKKWNSGFLTRPGEQKKSFTRPVRRKHRYFFFGLIPLFYRQKTLPTLIPPSWIRGQAAIFENGYKP